MVAIVTTVGAVSVILSAVDAKTGNLRGNFSLYLHALWQVNTAHTPRQLFCIPLLESLDSIVAPKVLTNWLINLDHLVHFLVKQWILLFDSLCVLCKSHDVLSDAHLSDLAIVFELDFLQVDLSINCIDWSFLSCFLIFQDADLSHE